MPKDNFTCEFCAQDVNTYDFMYLSANEIYRSDDNVFIVHKDCADPDGWKITQVYETKGDLRLVRVSSS